jgi:hypothetical protein
VSRVSSRTVPDGGDPSGVLDALGAMVSFRPTDAAVSTGALGSTRPDGGALFREHAARKAMATSVARPKRTGE